MLATGARRRRPRLPLPLPAVTPSRPAPRLRAAAPPGPLAERTFAAADGRRWRVREHVVRPRDGDAHRRLLVFECGPVLRWLRVFPADWHRRSAADLERLSWRV